MRVQVESFDGIAPRRHKRVLNQNQAQRAHNCRLRAGVLEPLTKPTLVGTVTDLISAITPEVIHLWRYDGNHTQWLGWEDDVDVVQSPLTEDEHDRIFFTGDGNRLRCRLWDAAAIEYDMYLARYQKPVPTMGATSPVETTVAAFALVRHTRMLSLAAGVLSDASMFTTPATGGSATAIQKRFTFKTDTRIEVEYDVAEVQTSEADDNSGALGGMFATKLPFVLTVAGTSYPAAITQPCTYDLSLPPCTFDVANIGRFRLVQVDTTRPTETIKKVTVGGLPHWTVLVGAHTIKLTFELDYSLNSYLPDTGLVSYVTTLVSKYGEESPPSKPSEIDKRCGFEVELALPKLTFDLAVTYAKDDEVLDGLDLFKSLQDTNLNNATTDVLWWEKITTYVATDYPEKIRIYRTTTGTSGGQFRFVDEVNYGILVYTDKIACIDLAEVLQEAENPVVDMTCLVSLPGGYFAAAKGRTIYFSEPFKPYSWPSDYQLTVDWDIVALAVGGNDLYVLTDGKPYIIQGSAPETLAMTKLMINQSCASKRSVAEVSGMIVYASPDGLVALTGGSGNLVTAGGFTRREWQLLVPASMICCTQDDCVHMVCGYGESRVGYLFVLTDPQAASVMTNDVVADVWYPDLVDDDLYFVEDDSIYTFGTSDDTFLAEWKSKQFTLPGAVSFSALLVAADSFPVWVDLFTPEGFITVQVQDKYPCRIPVIPCQAEWEFQVRADVPVARVAIASSVDMLNQEPEQ